MTLSPEMRRDAAYPTLRVDEEAIRYIPAGFAHRHDVLPYGVEGSELYVAVPDAEPATVDRIRLLTGMRINAATFARDEIRRFVAVAYGLSARDGGADEGPPSAVRLVDEIHSDATLSGATDLHVEPTETGGRIRQRVDGHLSEIRVLERELYLQTIARLKVLASLDVADRRQPQDGRYTFESRGRAVDARVSVVSTADGERVAIRLFDSSRQRPCLDELGMDAQTVHRFRKMVRAAHGFIVVCGPTGSGKTTTLYAALEDRKSEREHLCTIEDPIEMRLRGVAQIQVNVRAGLTFASALRAVLRQDPDVVMVGEMRDSETAGVAASAALSGQLVLTTMHSFDASRALERLVDLGVPRHALAASLTGIVSQRLVRTSCSTCSDDASRCAACSNTHFSGRTGIFECIVIGEELREAIASNASSQQLRRIVERSSPTTLARDGLRQVMAGRTTAGEVERVLGERSEP